MKTPSLINPYLKRFTLWPLGFITLATIVIILIARKDISKTPITAWITIPTYPRIEKIVSQVREDNGETIEFMTTDSITTVLRWYDETFLPNEWYDIRGAPELYPLTRSYIYSDPAVCYHFKLSVQIEQSTNIITQDQRRIEPRACR